MASRSSTIALLLVIAASILVANGIGSSIAQDDAGLARSGQHVEVEYQVLGQEFTQRLGTEDILLKEGGLTDEANRQIYAKLQEILNEEGKEGWILVEFRPGMAIFQRPKQK